MARELRRAVRGKQDPRTGLRGRRRAADDDEGKREDDRSPHHQKCEVMPAGSESGVPLGSSDHDFQYLPSSSFFASFVSRSGWNVSHITASSCVSVRPIDFSARPGCGPCGMPDGWSVTDPTSTPFREPNWPET